MDSLNGKTSHKYKVGLNKDKEQNTTLGSRGFDRLPKDGNDRSAETEKNDRKCGERMEADQQLSGTDGGRRFWRHDSAPFHTGSLDPESPLGITSEAPICASRKDALHPAARLCVRDAPSSLRRRPGERALRVGLKPSVRSKGRRVTQRFYSPA